MNYVSRIIEAHSFHGLTDDPALQIDYTEIGCAHLLVKQAITIDEEMVRRAWDFGCDVIVNKI